VSRLWAKRDSQGKVDTNSHKLTRIIMAVRASVALKALWKSARCWLMQPAYAGKTSHKIILPLLAKRGEGRGEEFVEECVI
jgi:hypothetical protein